MSKFHNSQDIRKNVGTNIAPLPESYARNKVIAVVPHLNAMNIGLVTSVIVYALARVTTAVT